MKFRCVQPDQSFKRTRGWHPAWSFFPDSYQSSSRERLKSNSVWTRSKPAHSKLAASVGSDLVRTLFASPVHRR